MIWIVWTFQILLYKYIAYVKITLPYQSKNVIKLICYIYLWRTIDCRKRYVSRNIHVCFYILLTAWIMNAFYAWIFNINILKQYGNMFRVVDIQNVLIIDTYFHNLSTDQFLVYEKNRWYLWVGDFNQYCCFHIASYSFHPQMECATLLLW